MTSDVNTLLDLALEKVNALSKKQEALVVENANYQKKIMDLQVQVDAGTLHPDQEKKIQDLVNLLEQLLK